MEITSTRDISSTNAVMNAKKKWSQSHSLTDTSLYLQVTAMHLWKRLFFVTLTGVIILLLNFKSPTELDFYDHPDMLPYRVSIREIRGKLVWQSNGINIGLPISHIRDLGQNKTRFLLVIIVSTAPLRWERRDAIRQTWWKHCRVKEVSDFFRLISSWIVYWENTKKMNMTKKTLEKVWVCDCNHLCLSVRCKLFHDTLAPRPPPPLPSLSFLSLL